MSCIVVQKNNSILISHKSFVDSLYFHNVSDLTGKICSFEVNTNIFKNNGTYDNGTKKHRPVYNGGVRDLNIIPPRCSEITLMKSKKHKKRKIDSNNSDRIYSNRIKDEIQKLINETSDFMKFCIESKLLRTLNQVDDNSEEDTQTLLKLLFSKDGDNENRNFFGENNLDNAIITTINNQYYIIPSKCKFYQKDVKNIKNFLEEYYDFVVIDPPWINKYIKRIKKTKKDFSYEMLTEGDILNIPIETFIMPNSLVIIWCTNAPSHINSITTKFLPKWNLKLLGTWYWIKITNHGETICEFNLPLRKQPYEQLFVACHRDSDEALFKGIPKEKYIFSVPSAIHSHKPPLQDLFTKFLPKHPKCLEIFARYLLRNFTSYGLEVLKLQNLKLYKEI